MKTRYIGLVLIALFFFNCDSGSTGNDDDFLNGSNYISENNFYTYYLSQEIADLQIEIDALQAIIDSGMGDATTQDDLDEAIADQDVFEDERELNFINGNPVPINTAPSVCPEPNTCFSSQALYFVTHNRFHELEIQIFDDQDDLIYSSTGREVYDLPGANDYIYIEVYLNDYTGPVTILAEKYDSDDNLIDYFIEGYSY